MTNKLDLSYDENDDRKGVDAFTIAVAEQIAKKSGLVLSSLRNYSEPGPGSSKASFISLAYRITDPFLLHPSLDPIEVAEAWRKVGLG